MNFAQISAELERGKYGIVVDKGYLFTDNNFPNHYIGLANSLTEAYQMCKDHAKEEGKYSPVLRYLIASKSGIQIVSEKIRRYTPVETRTLLTGMRTI